MKAVILAGGKGTRLKPYTTVLPKPLVPVGEKAILEILISRLKKAGVTEIYICLIDGLPDNFLVMNGDLLTDLDFADLYKNHLNSNALLTVSTYKRNVKVDFGVIDIDTNLNQAIGFREKPEYNFQVSMGVNVLSKKVLDLVPDNQAFGFDNLMYTLLEKKERINTYQYDGYWLDIGRPDDYEKANEDIEKLNKIL